MKRFIFAFLSLLFLLPCASLAEGRIEVTNESFLGGCYYFARIENTGDEATIINGAYTLDFYDADANEVYTKELCILGYAPIKVEPGEYFYVHDKLYTSVDDAEYFGSFFIPEDRGIQYVRQSCEVNYGVGYEGQFAVFDVTVRNDTEKALEEYMVTLAALSMDDRLMYVDSLKMTNVSNPPSITIPPHSSIVMRFVLAGYDTLMEVWKNEEMQIGSVKADLYYADR